MKIKKEYIGTININKLLIKQRIILSNKTIPHKNKKKEKEKYKCRKKVKI